MWPAVFGLAAAAGGLMVARSYAAAGLTLAHYDAKAHLVVARRLADSITPGYQQIGAVWLPLPHLLNAIFVQYDPWFRSGASAVAISTAAFALAVFAAAALAQRATGSSSAGAIAAGAIAINPNLLYLQSTPMTEPLLLGLTFLAVWLLWEWLDGRPVTRAAGTALALACLTRYEAWPVAGAALGAAWLALWRGGLAAREALVRVRSIAWMPLAAIAGFLIHSRVTVGEWFVQGFYTPDNPARHDWWLTSAQVWWGVTHLSGSTIAIATLAGTLAVLTIGLFSRKHPSWLLLVAPLACAAVPWLAFFGGHPYRIRYLVPLVAAGAVPMAALAAIVPRRWRVAAVVALAAAVLVDLRPLDARAPMIAEAQWDRPNSTARRRVIDCLSREFTPGEKVMASMGSLAHFMQETASAGFTLNDFLHEGNGDIWLQALVSPRPYVEWIAIQEYAEGGDMLAQLSRQRPAFLNGFVRVCDGGGVGLYGRQASGPRRQASAPF